mgnify:CR=1 FL=1|jgi:hypothetical protein
MPVTYFKVKPESAMYKNFFIENTERKKLKKHISEFMKNHFGNGKHEVWTTLYPSLVMTLSSEKAKELSHQLCKGALGDTVELFGQNGTVTFDGIVFQNGVPWEAIKDKVWQLYKSSPCLVNKTNFLSFIETIMNFCDDIEGTKLPFVKKINNKEVTHDDKKAC